MTELNGEWFPRQRGALRLTFLPLHDVWSVLVFKLKTPAGDHEIYKARRRTLNYRRVSVFLPTFYAIYSMTATSDALPSLLLIEEIVRLSNVIKWLGQVVVYHSDYFSLKFSIIVTFWFALLWSKLDILDSRELFQHKKVRSDISMLCRQWTTTVPAKFKA